MKLELSRTLKYQDKEFTEIELDLDNLTGQDLIDAEEGLKRKGITVNAWEYSREYLIAVAARAMKVPAESVKQLSAKDFTAIVNEVLTFLAGAASVDSAGGSSKG